MFKAYWSLEDLPEHSPPCALAIGNFDGLHRGHQKILEKTKEKARAVDGKAVALTFDPHPTKIVAPERAPALLMKPAERLRCFEELGLDAAVVLRFTEQVARLSPEEFIETVVVEKLHARSVVVGRGFRFGHRQAGDLDTLIALGSQYGFDVEAVEPLFVEGTPISSTRIREAVQQGRLDEARVLLGRPFSLQGKIIPGTGTGSRKTVPTLNLSPDTELRPVRGVYVTLTKDREHSRRWESVTNVGSRPTFNGTEQTIETFLLDDLQGSPPARIELSFLRRLRDEKRFESAEALREQILRDAEEARQYFRRLTKVGDLRSEASRK